MAQRPRPRGSTSRRFSIGLLWLGVAVVAALMVSNPATASPLVFSKVFRPPYVGSQIGNVSGMVQGCASYPNLSGKTSAQEPIGINYSTGSLWANVSESVNGGACAKNYSQVQTGFSLYLGVGSFSVPAPGWYNISYNWKGSLWANVTVVWNSSARQPLWANMKLTESLALSINKQRSYSIVNTSTFLNVNIKNGSSGARHVDIKSLTPTFREWLSSGVKYSIVEIMGVFMGVHGYTTVASQGASASDSLWVGSGFTLKAVKVA